MKTTTMWAAALAAAMVVAAAGSAEAQQVRRYDYATGSWVTMDANSPRAQRALVQQRRPAPQFQRAHVRISTKEKPGTIIVDSQRKYLYFVEPGGTATRYGVGVGKEGFGWGGNMRVGAKAEWPTWTPPKQMIAREAAKGHIIPNFMDGGPGNPLGARAMYLYHDGRDSLFRIHGTNQPWTIGHEMSSGCIRMMNEDVVDLYSKVPVGTKVIVIGPNGQGSGVYAELGRARQPGLLETLFGS